jgi:hypothetical protein
MTIRRVGHRARSAGAPHRRRNLPRILATEPRSRQESHELEVARSGRRSRSAFCWLLSNGLTNRRSMDRRRL